MMIWIPKWLRRRPRGQRVSLHCMWDVQVRRADGSVRFDWTGKNAIHNIVHDEGARYLLDLAYGRTFTTSTNSPYCDLMNGTYDHTLGAHELLLTDADTSGAFDLCAVGDWIYLCGGSGAGGHIVPGWYQILFKDSADIIGLALDPTSAAGDMAGVGAVATPMRRAVLYVGLDSRPTIAQTDVMAGAEGYEEDGTGYARRAVDPDTAAEWTISYDGTAHKYKALSIQETFTATAANWQENRNLFLAAGYAAANTAVAHGATTAGQLLLSSAAFPAAFTLGDAETVPVQGKFYLHEDR